jgi:hypothetical protein
MLTCAALYATIVFSAASFLSVPVLNSARYLITIADSVKECHNCITSAGGLQGIKLPIVVTLHFEIEDLGLRSGGRGHKV